MHPRGGTGHAGEGEPYLLRLSLLFTEHVKVRRRKRRQAHPVYLRTAQLFSDRRVPGHESAAGGSVLLPVIGTPRSAVERLHSAKGFSLYRR